MSFLLKKELGSAKSERKKDRVKVSIKSFQTMIKYCEGTFCRHSVFSKYFGDDPPDCKKRCDTCKNVKAVEKKTVAFQGVGASGGSGGFR
jgi:ATP-dependent DNA helicase Q5